MRSFAFADFLIGLAILFVIEGLMFAASPTWMRRAMKSADTRFLLRPDSDFFRYFSNPSGKPAEAPPATTSGAAAPAAKP